MPAFEVFIPAKDPSSPNVTLTIDAPNWIGALKTGLKQIGEGQDAIANVMCDIKEDNSIHVTEVTTRRVFRLRELGVPAPAAEAAPVEAATLPPSTPAPRPVSMPEVPAIADHEPTLKNPVPPASDAGFMGGPKTLLQFQAPKLDMKLPKLAEGQDTMQIAAAPGMPAPAAIASPAPPPATPSDPPAEAPPAAPPAAPVTARIEPKTLATMPAATVGPVVPVTLIAMPAAAPPPTEAPTRKVAAPAASPPFVEDTQKIPLPDLEPASTPKPIAKVELKKVTAPLQPAAAPTPRGVPAPAPKRPSGQFQNAPVTQSRAESPPAKTDPAIGRREPAKSQVSVTDAIAEVFDATQDLYLEPALTRQKIAEKMLDIALSLIPSESGTFYLADVNGHELVFAAVRGPKADAIKRSGMKVKVGQGIIGFCAQEGVCLLVSDIQKDARHHAEVAAAIGYQPRDTVCASAEKDGRLFGALQLINSQKGFDAAHMEVARYIGLTAAALLERLEG